MSNESKGLSKKACIMMAVGGMVGSSIFSLSGVTYGMAGAAAILFTNPSFCNALLDTPPPVCPM